MLILSILCAVVYAGLLQEKRLKIPWERSRAKKDSRLEHSSLKLRKNEPDLEKREGCARSCSCIVSAS